MTIVVALGGNALLHRGEPAEAAIQRQHVAAGRRRARRDVPGSTRLVLTHGNGPQVGLLALEADAYKEVSPYPLDVLGAESQGMIGYLLVQALRNELPRREIVAVLTQVLVAVDDPAFRHPTKPIGPVYHEVEARALAREHGWSVAPEASSSAASFPPLAPADRRARRSTAWSPKAPSSSARGGGGIPVVHRDGRLQGIEAVIDKDLTAARLAADLGARRLVLADRRAVRRARVGNRAGRADSRGVSAGASPLAFASGSMGPKVEAACRFVEQTGGEAAIGALCNLRALVRGTTGTQIRPDPNPLSVQ